MRQPAVATGVAESVSQSTPWLGRSLPSAKGLKLYANPNLLSTVSPPRKTALLVKEKII